MERFLKQLVEVCRSNGYEIRDAAIYDNDTVVAAHVFVNAAACGYVDPTDNEIKTVSLRDEK